MKKTYKASADHLPEVVLSVDRKIRCRSSDAGGRFRLRLVLLESRRLSRRPCCQRHNVIAHAVVSGKLATHRSFPSHWAAADLDAHCRCLLLSLATDRSRPSLPTFSLGNRTASQLSPCCCRPFSDLGLSAIPRVGFPLLSMAAGPFGVPCCINPCGLRSRRLRLERFRTSSRSR